MVNIAIAVGTVKTIINEQTSQGAAIRILVVHDVSNPKYPTLILCRFFGNGIAKTEGVTEGQLVRIDGSTKGREHNGRYFSEFSAWNLVQLGAATQAKTPGPTHSHVDASDDVPF